MPSPVYQCKERLAAEHGSELLAHAAEHLLDAGVVADEGDSHLEALGRDVADRGLDVVRDPLDEVGRVLVLHVEHLLVDLLCRHAAAEERGRRQVAAVAWVGPASCSWRRTSAASARAPTGRGTAASHGS
ncbi:hypothetical protein ERJ75_000884200 [Trypanosoma vivax]|nr:hypothetical protein ERJ75_000884200 [Trypanosoma vivax]